MSQNNVENMNPDASPGQKSKSGVRKVNNVPLYILAFAIGCFLIIMMSVASDRAESQNKPPKNEALRTVNSAINYVDNIAGQHKGGIIKAEDYTLPVRENKNNFSLEKENSDDNSITSSKIELDPLEISDDNNSILVEKIVTKEVFSDDELRRFRLARLQLFEKAVKSKTSVNAFNIDGERSGFSGSPKTQLAAVRNELSNLGSQRDPTQVYKTQLAKLKSIISGEGSPTALTGSLGSKNTGAPSLIKGNWNLNSDVEAPKTSYVLRAGYVIPGLMISGINSELPGQIIAQVSQDVYDTATGRYLLIPQGSRLVGGYSSKVVYGQSRVMVAWDRIIFPDGKAMDIAGMQGADSAGYAGYTDQVNNHFWKVFSSAFLMSGIVAGVNLSQNSDIGTGVNNRQRAGDAMSEALGQQLGQAMTQMIVKNINVAPTLEIRPGYRFNVMVNKDMVMTKPYESFDY